MEKLPTVESLPKPEFEIRRERSLEFAALNQQNYADVGDEEAIFMLALTLGHPEWHEEIFKQIKKYKPHVPNPEAVLQRIQTGYLKFQEDPQKQLDTNEIERWKNLLPEVEARIANLLNYFKPSINESPRKIVIVPSDKLLSSKNTGRSFHIGDTTLIMSHTENLDNVEHEFLHGIINPITEQFESLVSDETVISLASNKYKVEEMYGEHALSLLNEELIRTYNDLIKVNEQIQTRADFKNALSTLNDMSFAKILINEPNFKTRLDAMSINSLSEFIKRADEYFDHYGKNELRERIYELYQKYNQHRSQEPHLKFKTFFSKEIGNILAPALK